MSDTETKKVGSKLESAIKLAAVLHMAGKEIADVEKISDQNKETAAIGFAVLLAICGLWSDLLDAANRR